MMEAEDIIEMLNNRIAEYEAELQTWYGDQTAGWSINILLTKVNELKSILEEIET